MSKVILITMGSESPLLFRASIDNQTGEYEDGKNTSYPLGILYLSSALKKEQHEVKVMPFNRSFETARMLLASEIKKGVPEFVCISCITQTRTNCFKMIEYLHEHYPNINIVLGGIHPTIMHEQISKKYPYIAVLVGEGEITLPKLIANYHSGVVFGETVKDLNTLEFPDHGVYLENGYTTATIIRTRGCYGSCSFCCLNPTIKYTIRSRSVDNTIQEIKEIINNYPNVTEIAFMDDSFLANNNGVIELCNAIVNNGLSFLNYTCVAKFKPFSHALVKPMEDAGFVNISFGLESANERILERCNKHLKQSDVIKTITLLKHSKIQYSLYIIVGLPGENINTILETSKFINELKKIKYTIISDATILSVYPGTELYRELKSNNQIDDDYWLSEEVTPVYTMENSFIKLLMLKKKLLDEIHYKNWTINMKCISSITRFLFWKVIHLRSNVIMVNNYEPNYTIQ